MSEKDCTLNHSLYGVIFHATASLEAKIKDNTAFSDVELKACLADAKSLSQLLSLLDQFNSVQPITETQEDLCQHIVRDICFPLLYSLHLLPESEKVNSEKGRALSLLVSLILACCRKLKDQSLSNVIIQLLIPLSSAAKSVGNILLPLADELYHKCKVEPLNQYLSLELLRAILSDKGLFQRFMSNVEQLGLKEKEVLTHLFSITVYCDEENSVFSKAFTVLAKLFEFFPVELRKKCEDQVWTCYTSVSSGATIQQSKQSEWKSLYVFFCLKNNFFPLEISSKDVLATRIASNNFWLIVQKGIVSSEPLHRKLAVYLIKRLVDTSEKNGCSVNTITKADIEAPIFWWSPDAKKQLSALWEDFILLIEVLEEKQVHVIKPLLPRMQNLIEAASESPKEGFSSFHSSWLITIITRCFDHESHFMSRWAASTLLNLDFQNVPLVQHGQLKFLSHDLLIHLQENKLYARYEGTELGKSSPVGKALKGFFAHLFVSLKKEQKVEYLNNLLHIVLENSWGSIPLVFVFEGLSLIPPSCIIDSKVLELVREILQSCLTTHELFTKAAIQCFICQMLINLVDASSVTLKEIMRALAPLIREESLQRGTSLWTSALCWIGQAVKENKWTENEAVELTLAFLRDPQASASSVTVEGYMVVTIARMLILFADLAETKTLTENFGDHENIESVPNELKQEKKSSQEAVAKSPLGRALEEIGDTLSGISSRAYVNVGQVDWSLSLLYSLLREAGVLGNCLVDKLLKKNCELLFKDVSYFVKARVSQELTKLGDMEQVKFYSDVLLSLGLNSEHVHAEVSDILDFVSRVFAKSREVLSEQAQGEMDILVTSSVGLLATLCELVETKCKQKSGDVDIALCEALVACIASLQNVPQPFSRKAIVKSDASNVQSRANVGQAISSFITSKWQCRRFMFTYNLSIAVKNIAMSKASMDVLQILDSSMDDLSIGSGMSDVAIYKAIDVIMSEVIAKASQENISKFIELSWSKLTEEKKNRLFWKKLEVYVPLALHPGLLSQDSMSVIGQSLDELFDKLQTLGADKTGILYLVYENLCVKSLNKENDPDRQLATRLIPLLVEGTYFGQVHKRGERLWLDVCAYLENSCEASCINHIMSNMSKDDLFTRVALLNWLSKLSPADTHDVMFVLSFLEHLRAKYVALAKLTTYKQYSNNLSHRQKHRMVLVFLLLAKFINKDMCEQYLSTLWYALEIECHPSVRQNLEWLVLILLKRYPQFVGSLWDVFKLYATRRSVCLCSLFLIISHTGFNLPHDQQTEFFKKAFTAVLPWSMAHHYNTRIFAQTTLVKMWEQCQSLQLKDIMTEFSMVQSVVDFFHTNGNASATVLKLYGNYMFHDFDPVADYSMETIFYTLPKLACIADDEWCSPAQFARWDKTWLSESGRLAPLKNPTQRLAQCKPGPWRMKAHNENEEDISESADNTGDVQKKIMPWRQMSPDQDTEAELASSQRQKGRDGGLVLVTSLIDKVPNLGGLCRTSEIFGVSEFVLGNLTYLEDRMFQSLSVSAQKWINITEVMKPRVPEYIEQKRAEGYTLVGVEQTANSVPLHHYKFPKKTLLLLGNEKEGIPVDILQSLDVCVEIPQLGIIRSLNVHVCGALIVWEYTRQVLQQQEEAEATQKESITESK